MCSPASPPRPAKRSARRSVAADHADLQVQPPRRPPPSHPSVVHRGTTLTATGCAAANWPATSSCARLCAGRPTHWMRARPIPPFRRGPSRYPRRSPGHHRLSLIAIESPLLDIDDYTVSESTWASIDLLERAQQRTLDGGPVIDVVGTADSHAATHTRAHSYRRGRPRYSAVRTAKPDLCSGAVASRGLMRRRLSRARSSCVAINASSAQAENTTAVTGGRPPNVDTRGGSKTRLDVAAF